MAAAKCPAVSIRNDMVLLQQRPLRITVVTETFPPEVNGVANSIGRVCAGLLARGVRLQIARPRQADEDRHPHCIEAEHLLVSGLSLPNYPAVTVGFPAGRRLARAWKASRPDIVHIATEGPLGWSALHAARRLGIAVSSSFHTNFQGYAAHYGARFTAKAVMAYLRYFHNRTGVTIVPTEQMREKLVVQGIFNLAVVGRGVDTKLFRPSRRNLALRQQLGAGENAPVVLHVGRLAPEKNLSVLFDAFAAIRRHRADARLVIVGDGPERSRLEREHPGHHFAGMITGAALAEHYASADLFLYPSLTETFGNVTLEAMASGLAVVAFDYAAAREHMRHMENGVLVPFGDAKSFIEMSSMLARSSRTIQKLREHASAKAGSLDWDRIIDAFLGQMLATHSAHHREQGSGNPAGTALAV